MNFPCISSKGRLDTLLAKTLPLSHPQVDNPHTIPSLFVICLNRGSNVCQ